MRVAIALLLLGSACSSEAEAPHEQAVMDEPGMHGGGGGSAMQAAGTGGAAPSGTGGSHGAAANTGSGGRTASGTDAGLVTSGSGGATGGAHLDASMPDAQLPRTDAGMRYDVRALSPGPSYMGSGDGGCTKSYASTGHAPVDDSGKHPLFLYFVGTSFSADDESSRYTSPAAAKVTEAMARRGFVALSVDYDNSLSLDLNKASCLYASNNPESMLAVACALPEVDCDLGIATWGHSQGAAIAHGAAMFDARVRAVWTTGYSGGDSPLPPERLRVVNGENDSMNSPVATLNKAAGLDASTCPDDGRSECLRADGSGWILVRKSACQLNSADHCWFDKASCVANMITLEPAWIEPSSTAPFALEANADWVAATVARP
jgi:hypothetical protein